MILYYFTFALLLIYCYFAGTEFGYSVWQLASGRGTGLRDAVVKQLSPLYELTNTFFVVFAIMLVAVYPKASLIYGTVLLVPMTVGVICVGIRSFSILYLHYRNPDNRVVMWLLAISGIVAPFFLTTFFSVSIQNTISIANGNIHYSLTDILLNPVHLWIAAVVIIQNIYFAALHLASTKQKTTVKVSAAVVAVVMEFLLLLAVVALRDTSLVHWLITGSDAWPLFIGYLISFPLVVMLLYWNKEKYLRVVHVLQLVLLYGVYLAATYPYILTPFITVNDTTSVAMYTALVYGTLGGLIVLVPALIYLATFLKRK